MSKFNQKKLNTLKKIDLIYRSLYLLPRNKRQYQIIVKNEIKEILVMGIWLIGDTIMHLPILTVLKKNYPNAKITVVCEKQTEIILRNQNLVNEFIIIKCPWVVPMNYSFSSLANFFLSARMVNKIRYDMAVEFRGDWRSIFYMNFIKSSRKISYSYSGGEYMLTDVIVPDESIKNLTAESLYLLKQIGCDYIKSDEIPRLTLTAEDKAYLKNFQLVHDFFNKFVIGIHPGTSQEVKRWDENNYAELIIKLAALYTDLFFIIYEGPNERNSVSIIEKMLKKRGINYIVINRSLHEYVVLLSLSQLLISNDSGAAHIAGAYGIPVVVIFGNRGPEFVYPYGSTQQEIISHELDCKPCFNTFCKFGDRLCLTGITVEEVYGRARKIIDTFVKKKFS